MSPQGISSFGLETLLPRDIAALIQVSVDVWGEENIPEMRRVSQELDRNERAFLIHLGRTDDIHLYALLRFRILESELSALRKALMKNNHRTAGADRVRVTFQRFWLTSKMHEHAHAQQHALRTAAFFRGGLPRQSGAWRIRRIHRAGLRVR